MLRVLAPAKPRFSISTPSQGAFFHNPVNHGTSARLDIHTYIQRNPILDTKKPLTPLYPAIARNSGCLLLPFTLSSTAAVATTALISTAAPSPS